MQPGPIAQTNLQLLNHLDDLGWSIDDRSAVARAYGFAFELFVGQTRLSGKSFVEHLVGTAAIVATARGTVDEVTASLLHAAYLQGDFGDGRSALTEHKRRTVRDAVGGHAEELIRAYRLWPWRDRIAALLSEGVEALTSEERPVALMRIANEIDEHADNGSAYAPETLVQPLSLEDAAAAGTALDRPELAVIATALAEANTARSVPDQLRRPREAPHSFTGRSSGTRVWVRITGERSGLRRAARRIPYARAAVHRGRAWMDARQVPPEPSGPGRASGWARQ